MATELVSETKVSEIIGSETKASEKKASEINVNIQKKNEIWALLPVKPFSHAKQRLSAFLNQTDPVRSSQLKNDELARAMLLDVLFALKQSQRIDRIAVVSAESELKTLLPDTVFLIDEVAAYKLQDNHPARLNQALSYALEILRKQGVQHCAILPADIPLIETAELDACLLRYLEHCANHGPDAIAMVPSQDKGGTNLLCLNPYNPINLGYGSNSYQRHISLAAGKHPLTLSCPSIEKDIDTQADLRELLHYCESPDPQLAHSTCQLLTERYCPQVFEKPGQPLDAFEALDKFETLDKLEVVGRELSLSELCQKAAQLRDQQFGSLISYSRKVFIPLTRLCRDVCHYCTFATVPREVESPYLSVEQVLDIARQGQAQGCKEALFTLGEKPELRYRAAREALDEMGFTSTLEYLAHVAKKVLEETGLLPHINAGCMTPEELAMLRPFSPSMGIMLENISPRLCEKGQPHFGSPDKQPAMRLETLANAGRAKIAMTTGILIGIGETRTERLESLIAIADLHRQFGHIQEVIVQNFVPKPDTKMAHVAEPAFEELQWTIAMARLILPVDISLQVPPNLNQGKLKAIINAGINDWGGVSPITPDHVNPESPWPHLDNLAAVTAQAGKSLQQRLTIYPQFLSGNNWLDKKCRSAVLALADGQGLAREDDWLTGVSKVLPEKSHSLHKSFPAKLLLQTVPEQILNSQPIQPSKDIGDILDRIRQQALHADLPAAQDIATLFTARGDDLTAVCRAADELRQKTCGDVVTYVVNRNINYTNICTYHCGFCAFSKGSKHLNGGDGPYLKSIEDIVSLAREARENGATEVCLQGGIHPQFSGQTYLDICQAINVSEPDLHIHAFSPLEVWHGAETLGLPLKAFLIRLKQAGLKTLPGTAAEILHDDVRAIICPDKLNTAQWLEVMETAHSVGLRTTATIMFGHVDHYHHWAAHLLAVLQLQQRTGGFTEFVPLPFVADEAPLYKRGQSRRGPTLRESVLMHAVARLVLSPHIANIQTSWVKMGLEGAKLCLRAGANDLGGVLMNESITRAAGASHGQQMDPRMLVNTIRDCNRLPRQRTTLYGKCTTESGMIIETACLTSPDNVINAVCLP